MGGGWNDYNYRQLGSVLSDCDKALRSIELTLLNGGKILVQLCKAVEQYENTSINGSGGGSSAGSSGSGSSSSGYSSPEEIQAQVMDAGKASTDSFTSEEVSAIRDYTGNSSYSNINACLRGYADSFDPGNYETAVSIHEALGRTQIPCACTVYRGTSLEALGPYQDWSDEQLVGVTLTDGGFMSTSLYPEDAFSGRVQMEISVPEGAPGAYIGQISAQGHQESEVLFDCGRSIRITNVSRDQYGNRIIYADMVIR